MKNTYEPDATHWAAGESGGSDMICDVCHGAEPTGELVRYFHRGPVGDFEHVPAMECPICGDQTFRPDVVDAVYSGRSPHRRHHRELLRRRCTNLALKSFRQPLAENGYPAVAIQNTHKIRSHYRRL